MASSKTCLRISYIWSEQVPVSIADLGGTEIDLRFASPKQGRLFVIVAPVLRFADSESAINQIQCQKQKRCPNSRFTTILCRSWWQCHDRSDRDSGEGYKCIRARGDRRERRRQSFELPSGRARGKNVLPVRVGATSCYHHSNGSRKPPLLV